MLDVDHYALINSLPQVAIDLLLTLIERIEDNTPDKGVDHVLLFWRQITDAINQEHGRWVEPGRFGLDHRHQGQDVNVGVEGEFFEEVETGGWRVFETHGAHDGR